MKNIKELTNIDAIDILTFVYPKYDKSNFISIKHDVIIENGKQQITFGGNPIIGIEYFNDYPDRCILPFNNTKVVLWLYKNNFDISEYLETNKHHSDIIDGDFSDMAFYVYQMSKGEESFQENYKHNWTLEYVKKKCNEIYNKYYLKDYA